MSIDPRRVAEHVRILGRLLAGYPYMRGKIEPETLEVWAEVCYDLEPEVLRQVCEEWMRDEEWFPRSMADLRRKLANAQLEQLGVEPAERAWERVYELLVKHSGTGVPRGGFGDRVTDQVMTGAWWRRLLTSEQRMIPSERRAFVDAYRAVAGKLRRQVQLGQRPTALAGRAGPPLQLVAGGEER